MYYIPFNKKESLSSGDRDTVELFVPDFKKLEELAELKSRQSGRELEKNALEDVERKNSSEYDHAH